MTDTVGYVLILGMVVIPISIVMLKLITLLLFILQNHAIVAAAPF